jgi:DNA topoisomerase-1
LEGKLPPTFEAKLNKIEEKKAEVRNEEEANKILSEIQDAVFTVTDVQKKERKRNPSPPFITSTLQQEASRKLRFSPKKTMTIAQMLYEGIKLGEEEGSVGLITYMRTDSTRTSDEAVQGARNFVEKNFGKEFIPSEPNVYKTKKNAQDAHEAIRPTYMDKSPAEIKQYLTKDQNSLYELVWNRFISSQMAPAKIDQTGVDIKAKTYLFRATGATVTFPGFMKIYVEGEDSKEENGQEAASGVEKTVLLPPLAIGEKLKTIKITPKQHFTQPPPRFSEAMLIRELEEKGIGRPSTYAATVGLIKDREYVGDNNRRLFPSELGFLVNDQLVENFPDIIEATFTANMENQLDLVEEGKVGWVETLRAFYTPFQKDLEKAEIAMKDFKKEGIETDEVCEKCGKPMLIKRGRFGKFMACAGYPECKTTKKIQAEGESESAAAPKAPDLPIDEKCPKCGAGMVIKSGRFGKFISCSKYPECKTTKPIGIGVRCPQEGCDGEIVEKRSKAGRSFFGCSKYPDCKFASWSKPVSGKCPQCQHLFLVEKFKEGEKYLACPQKECNYRKEVEEEAEAEVKN